MDRISKLLPGTQKNISLKNYTAFKIGGKAKYFFLAKNKEDLLSAIKAAKKTKLAFFILGGGSNLLVSDKGFNGLVIKILFSRTEFPEETKVKMKTKFSSPSKIFAEAGIKLGNLVNASVKKNLSGLEWLAGIPGTMGGAVFGNAGAFGKSMKDVVKKVEVFDANKGKIRFLKNKDCRFNYRESIFKKKKNLIILSIEVRLKKSDKKTIKNRIKKYLDYKKTTQPLNYPSAGSVFKNPKNFSAAKLINRCGLKGKTFGRARISEKHANFIINLGKARAKDVMKLLNLTKKQVKKKFGVTLEEEIQFLPPKF